jgi:hypothetical protein
MYLDVVTIKGTLRIAIETPFKTPKNVPIIQDNSYKKVQLVIQGKQLKVKILTFLIKQD